MGIVTRREVRLLERIGIVASLSIGLAIVAYIFWRAGFGEIAGVLASANPLLVVAVIFTDQAATFLWTLRWREFLEIKKVLKLRLLHLINLIGMFAAAITPVARLGGEPVRIFLLGKYARIDEDTAAAAEATGAIFEVASVLATEIIVILLAATILALPLAVVESLLLFLAILGVLFVAAIELVFAKRVLIKAATDILILLDRIHLIKHHVRALRRRVIFEIERFETGMKLCIREAPLRAIGLSAARRGLEFVRMFLVVTALGIALPLPWLIVVVAAMLLAGYLPSPPGGLGIVEPAGMVVLIFSGITPGAAAAVVLLDRVLTLAPTASLGLLSIWWLGEKI